MGDPSRSADALLLALRARVDDAALRERAARALEREGRWREAVALLGERFTNVARHDDAGSLPCLCRACLDPAVTVARVEDLSFTRDFVVVLGRVLFFWSPDALGADRGRARRSVAASLEHHLRHPTARDASEEA